MRKDRAVRAVGRRLHCLLRPLPPTAAQAGSRGPSAGSEVAPFPEDYKQLVQQAQQAVERALADGHKLLEVEFPPTSLSSVPGRGQHVTCLRWYGTACRQLLCTAGRAGTR